MKYSTLIQAIDQHKMKCAARHILDCIATSINGTHITCCDTLISLFRIMYSSIDLSKDVADMLVIELQMKRVEIVAYEEA